MLDAWKKDDLVRALAGRILDRLDALPAEERKRPLLLRLDEKTLPELYKEPSPAQREYVWSLVEKMAGAAWFEIELDRRRGLSPVAYERSPRIRIAAKGAEGELRSLTGRVLTMDLWSQAWRRSCAGASWLPEELRAALTAREHRIGERSVQDIFSRWARLASERFEGLGLREVAAELFWGISKALDDRVELVAALRRHAGLPMPSELPLLLPAFLPRDWNCHGVLFVENIAAYAACIRGRVPAAKGHAIVYASGYKSAARRIRQPDMTLVAFDPSGDRAAEPEFLTWLRGSGDPVSTFFWGDLDYAGLSILRELRGVFPNARAWMPGYAPMVAAVERGYGHRPDEAEKRGQEDFGPVGCEDADKVLRPAIERTGLFFDQEGFGLDPLFGTAPR